MVAIRQSVELPARGLPCAEQGLDMIPTTTAGTADAAAEDRAAALACWGCPERRWCASLAVEGSGPRRRIHYGVWGGRTSVARFVDHIAEDDLRHGVSGLVSWLPPGVSLTGTTGRRVLDRYSAEMLGGQLVAAIRELYRDGALGPYSQLSTVRAELRARTALERAIHPSRLALAMAIVAADWQGCDTPRATTPSAVRAALIRARWVPARSVSRRSALDSARLALAGIGQAYSPDALDVVISDVRSLLGRGYVLDDALVAVDRSRPSAIREWWIIDQRDADTRASTLVMQ